MFLCSHISSSFCRAYANKATSQALSAFLYLLFFSFVNLKKFVYNFLDNSKKIDYYVFIQVLNVLWDTWNVLKTLYLEFRPFVALANFKTSILSWNLKRI